MQFWALMVDSFRESRDRKLFWVMLVVSVAVAGAMFCVGFEPGKISVLFGTWEFETGIFTVAGGLRTDLIAALIVDLIMELVLGTAGVILAIIATAGFFPTLMRGGAIDVLLSKPMSRPKLFLGKYFGSMVFIFVHATVFVVLTFLVAGFRWGAWLPGYLWTIPLLVLLFSYLYCISVLVAVIARSSTAAILLTLGVWAGFAGVQSVGDAFELYPSWKEYREVHNVVRTVRWVIPNTQDILYNARKWAGAGSSSELVPSSEEVDPKMLGRAARIEADRMKISPVKTIGSSLLFEAVIVLIAMWRFGRRDY